MLQRGRWFLAQTPTANLDRNEQRCRQHDQGNQTEGSLDRFDNCPNVWVVEAVGSDDVLL